MNNEQLMETAMLAGEIMLCSGAETYRVEDTMSHILKNADAEQKEVLVMMTGIMATLKKEGEKPSTIIKRVTDRGTNLNRVVRVNEVSRKLCSGELTVDKAYQELKKIASGRYKEFTSPLYHFSANYCGNRFYHDVWREGKRNLDICDSRRSAGVLYGSGEKA